MHIPLETSFKSAYMAAFLGSYAALNYDQNCQMAWPSGSEQPVEDAEFLAEEAYKQILEVGK